MAEIREIGKPALVSDGMFSVQGFSNIIPMVCASAYPAKLSDYSLANVAYYQSFENGWGLSDHNSGISLAKFFRANGCTYFERHVNFVDADSPDSELSFTAYMFGAYVDAIRLTKPGQPEVTKKNARDKWGDRWIDEVEGYFRPSGD
jgi:sialic acid synthase SpsE